MTKPTYSDSQGNRHNTDQIERKILKAGRDIIELQYKELGYNVCTKCKKNNCKPIDVSHDISRKVAKETGTVEVLWNINNLEILGRKCHKIKDRLFLRFIDEHLFI